LTVVLVRVLGAVATASPTEVEPALRPMERRLLTVLAVRRPASVSVEELIDALWAGAAPESARKTAQNNVLRVRQKLGAPAIETAGGGYRLGDVVDTDIARFEQAMREKDRRADPSEWDEVLAWCPESPLEDLRHWEPAVARRAHLDELRRSAVEARWDAALGNGDTSDAVAALEALVAEEPLREHRWVLLLAAYQAAGRHAEGLRAFERARRTLALELGASPGAELVEAYEALLRNVPVRIGAPAIGTTGPETDLTTRSDGERAAAVAALGRGDAAAAVESFVEAARLAREAGDVRRFAEAALAASGDGWRTGFDATADVVTLLSTALTLVPPAPTPLRSRLLARAAVVRSHHELNADCEALAQKALAIARALNDPGALAAALHALTVVVWDPYRRGEQRAWLDELVDLASSHPGEPWHRWAVPILALVLVREGDVAAAEAALDRLGQEAAECGDAGAVYAASPVAALRATVAGDWSAARAAVGTVCAAAAAAGLEPTGTAMQRVGMLGVIALLAGPTDVAPLPAIEWPQPALALAALAWHADCLARAGRIEDAAKSLAAIEPATISDVERDAYWLPTLSMLADAAYVAGSVAIAEAVGDCLESLTDLTIVDPGLIYRGSAAHAAGLAAATCGQRDAAVDLLTRGQRIHDEHRSPWMTERSRHALTALRPP
jgi:DNA-binding SARP family transcriptional activator